MNNKEIAEKLDGMKMIDGIGIKHYIKDNKDWLVIYRNDGSYVNTFAPADYFVHCRAVVDRVDGADIKLQKIFNALDDHLGDTDPDILEDATDEEIRDEEPVFWAANEIAKILKERG